MEEKKRVMSIFRIVFYLNLILRSIRILYLFGACKRLRPTLIMIVNTVNMIYDVHLDDLFHSGISLRFFDHLKHGDKAHCGISRIQNLFHFIIESLIELLQ